MNNTYDVFAEWDYYMLLLVDELKQRYEDITTCFDLFAELKHTNKRIWVNIRDRRWQLVNSYFASYNELWGSLWNCYIVVDYIERGFYDKYYIVNCMTVISYQRWRVEAELIATALQKQLQEKKKAEELKRLYGKQFNMFGGMD